MTSPETSSRPSSDTTTPGASPALGRPPTCELARWVPRQRTNLAEHREIVADCPTLGDLVILKSIDEDDFPRIVAGGGLEAKELSARPMPAAHAVLNDAVTFGDDVQLLPAVGREAM